MVKNFTLKPFNRAYLERCSAERKKQTNQEAYKPELGTYCPIAVTLFIVPNPFPVTLQRSMLFQELGGNVLSIITYLQGDR